MRVWKNKITYTLLVGMQNDTATTENILAVSCKAEHATTIQLKHYTLAFTPEKHKNLYKNTHSGCICNSQKLETIQMYFITWMVKQPVIHPYHGILHSNKKNELLINATTGMEFEEIMLS